MEKKTVKDIRYDTSFIVFPQDTNYMYPMIFGGKVLSEMDICAAGATRRLLYHSECDSAVTVGVNNVIFHIGAEVGDMLLLSGEISKLGHKSVMIHVTGWREKKDTGEKEKLCDGDFTFVSRKNGISFPHGLVLE